MARIIVISRTDCIGPYKNKNRLNIESIGPAICNKIRLESYLSDGESLSNSIEPYIDVIISYAYVKLYLKTLVRRKSHGQHLNF